MNTLQLPEPIAAYFAADAQGPTAVAACFTASAVVVDEGRAHPGRAAIQAWKAAASAAFDYTVRPCAVEQQAGVYTVTGRVSGKFPGSPVDLRYRFSLAQGLIASLEIAP